jgi:tRNA A37 threonylcarbamoyladenosine dehydratase
VDCVYSTEQLAYPTADGEVCLTKQGTKGAKNMDCATGFGSATMVTASFGFFASSKAIKKYLEKKKKTVAV